MTRQAFDALVRRIEDRYQGRQAALERATTFWVSFGLAFLLSWVVLIVGLGLLCFILGAMAEPPFSIILIVIGVSLTIYGALQAHFILGIERPPPAGYLVAAGEAPLLGSILESIRSDLRCRPFDEIRFTMDLNAAIREIPRLGLLGWSRTVLEIGLPLARAMSPDEFKAILAHEIVHVSARHGRSISRIYRLNRRWGNLFQKMQQPAGDSFTRLARSAITRFVNWYWPRLNARNLVLSRLHEFQADRDAARIAGNTAMAIALWRLEGLSPWLSDRFWPELFARTAEWPEPPVDIVARLTTAIQTPPAPEDAALWTERGLIRATLHDETHPALLDRVQALGLSTEDLRQIGFLNAAKPSAAETLLGDNLPAIERELSAKWHKENLGSWRDRYRRATSAARRQAAAPETSTSKPDQTPSVDVHKIWETAYDVVNLQGIAPAVPLLKRVLDNDPSHDGAAVILGRHLAVAGDPEGEAMLTRVLLRNDENWLPRACEALQEVYRASGQMDRLREIHARLDQHEADVRASQRERSTITASDSFAHHDLTDEQLAPLRELLAAIPGVGAGWLVRKKLSYFPKRPLFVLCVRGTVTRWWSNNAEQEYAIVRQLVTRVELPGQVLVIARQGTFRALARTCMNFPGSEVFRRDANT